jgi:palmitoyltransferase
LDSTRNVRILLLRGANRDSKSNENKTPIEYIPSEMRDQLKAELNKFLIKQEYCECLMMTTPLVPLERNIKTQALFLCFFLGVYFLNMFFILPNLPFYGMEIQIASGASTLLVIITFLFASCLDPGKLKPVDDRTFLELMRDINPADLCPECKVIRTARSRHCPICKQCVERYDHHCPWVNNCVGIKNHNSFLFFLIAIWGKITFHLVVDVWSLYWFFIGN